MQALSIPAAVAVIDIKVPTKTTVIDVGLNISLPHRRTGDRLTRLCDFISFPAMSCWSDRRRLSPLPSEISRADDGGRSCRNGSAPTHLYHARSASRAEPWWHSIFYRSARQR